MIILQKRIQLRTMSLFMLQSEFNFKYIDTILRSRKSDLQNKNKHSEKKKTKKIYAQIYKQNKLII